MQIYKKRKDYEKWPPVSVFVFRNEVEFVFSFVSIENNLPEKFFQIFSGCVQRFVFIHHLPYKTDRLVIG